MQSDQIHIKLTDCAGTIIINRPEDGNRLTSEMLAQFSEALDDLYYEKKVRAIIVTGSGDFFSEGLAWPEMPTSEADEKTLIQWGENASNWRDVVLRMLEITKPIIASVNGTALSAGAGLALASDIVIASNQAECGFPDPRHGLIAGVSAPLLCHRIGNGQAARLLLTSSTIEAKEALRIGLFHELVDQKNAWARAMEIARECAAGAPEAIQLTKRLLNETMGEFLETQLATGAIMRATSCTTEAAQEGYVAYNEKRPPHWW